jgi:hypothetical protein
MVNFIKPCHDTLFGGQRFAYTHPTGNDALMSNIIVLPVFL